MEHMEHKRCKSAYDAVEKHIRTVRTAVGLEGVKTVPQVGGALPEGVRFKGVDMIECDGPLAESAGKKLLQAAPDDEVWKKVVEKLSTDSRSKFSKLKAWATKFPSMLQTCGLIQTVAFYQDKSAHEVYPIVAAWLTGTNVPWPSGENPKDLMDGLNGLHDVELYRFLTREAMAYMNWVKRAVSVKLADVKQGE